MNNKLLVIAAVCALSLPSASNADTQVTVDFKGLTLGEASNKLAIQAGLTFAFEPKLGWRVGPAISLKDVPSEIAVEVLAAAYQVCFKRNPELITLIPCEWKAGRVEYR